MKVGLIHCGTYITADVSGNYSLQEGQDYFVMAIDFLVKKSMTRLLINCIKLEGEDTPVGKMQYAEFVINKLEETGIPEIKIAYLLNESYYKDAEFVDVVARNRGAWVKNFNKREEALEWLLSEDFD